MVKPDIQKPVPDLPIPFGDKTAWFAARTESREAVVSALRLSVLGQSTWVEGIPHAYNNDVFVTQPINGWVLAPSWGWFKFLDHVPGKTIGPALRNLSKAIGTVQFFATYRVPEYHIWGFASAGRLRRGYCYIGERGETVWSQGRATAAELESGPFTEVGVADGELLPNEESVMQIASRWSINPVELDRMELEPSLGLRCTPPARLPA
jgi:hypothetical protein